MAPGGTLLYCTCSLEPEEGSARSSAFLAQRRLCPRRRSSAGECGIAAEWLTAEGDLRTLPFHLPDERPELSGMDGFYAARLVRRD